jgi:transcription elongation factor Elf1
MKIKTIISQHRRDFQAIYECENCGHEQLGSGYDDARYHEIVIPKIICQQCKNTASSNYRPLTTKYPEGHVV